MAHTTTETTKTNYRFGDRVRYGCNLHNTGTFVRYTDTRPSPLAGRIVLVRSDHWNSAHGYEAYAWEADTEPARPGDVGGHYDPTTRRYVPQNW